MLKAKVIPLILISVRMGYDSVDHRIHCIVKKSFLPVKERQGVQYLKKQRFVIIFLLLLNTEKTLIHKQYLHINMHHAIFRLLH